MSEPQRSSNVVWQQGIQREQRWAALGHGGATIWMTGLPASGKSTIAAGVEATLLGAGRSAYVLDGDNLRHGLNGDLGFSSKDRAENVRRTAEVSALLADAGVVVLVADVAGTVAGYATLGLNRARALPQDGEVYELYMRPEYQGIGLGYALFGEARRLLKFLECRGVVVWCLEDSENAVRFFRSNGGTDVVEGIEDFERCRLVDVPAEYVAAEHQRGKMQVGLSETA